MTPPGWDTNPLQVSSQQTLVLIYLPRKDGKLSWLRRKRKLQKYSNLDKAGDRTGDLVVGWQRSYQLCQPHHVSESSSLFLPSLQLPQASQLQTSMVRKKYWFEQNCEQVEGDISRLKLGADLVQFVCFFVVVFKVEYTTIENGLNNLDIPALVKA